MMVSCIMPTADRPGFARRAVRMFQEQTYENRELIILDSGDSPDVDFVPKDRKIRYGRGAKAPLGELRNILCKVAKGEVIMHWDDDDLYAPHRIEAQLEHLTDPANLAGNVAVNGIDCPIFLNQASGTAFQYWWPAREAGCAWVHGATLAYYKGHHALNPFPAFPAMEDMAFLWRTASTGHPVVPIPLEQADWYVGVLHGDNTGTRLMEGLGWSTIPELPEWARPYLQTPFHDPPLPL